jgi:predicted component of type VI protein secretion system
LKQLEGFRIKKDEGLVTTRPREKDTVVTTFVPPGVAAFAQPSIRPNTRVVKKTLKATKDIPVNSVVTVPAASAAEKVKKKLKLVKPYYDPKWDEPPPPPAPEPEQQNARILPPKPKPRKKIVTSKFERGMRKRLKALQELFSDPRMAERLKIQVSKHVIKIPSKATDMEKALHKLLIAERKRWVKYINQNPRNKMTDNKAHDIIEKLAKS